MRALAALVAVLAMAAASRGVAGAQACPPGAASRLAALLAADQPVDVHLVAETLVLLCPGDPAADRMRVLDAIALVRLDEDDRARRVLAEVGEGPERSRARVLLSWSYLRSGDRAAYRDSAGELPSAERLRLDALAAFVDGDEDRFRRATGALAPPLRDRARALRDDWDDARCKAPWLAGTLSAILPGAGQVYAGSWQGAAVSFVINAVLIGATVELAREELWFSAGATGLAASVFYVGNIINAADLAERANDVASQPARDELERLLVPEIRPR